jgi:hypothetical protein
MAEKYRPTKQPKSYRQEFLKAVIFFLTVMPLVDLGLVNLIPDPCDFDYNLRRQMMSMAEARSTNMRFDPKDDQRLYKLMREDGRRSVMLTPPDAMRRQLRKLMPCQIASKCDPFSRPRMTPLTEPRPASRSPT